MKLAITQPTLVNTSSYRDYRTVDANALTVLFFLLLVGCGRVSSEQKVKVVQSNPPIHSLPINLCCINDSILGAVPDGRRGVLWNYKTGDVVRNIEADTSALHFAFQRLNSLKAFGLGTYLTPDSEVLNLGLKQNEIIAVHAISATQYGLIASLLYQTLKDSAGTEYVTIGKAFFDQVFDVRFDKAISSRFLKSDPYNFVPNIESIMWRGALIGPHIRTNTTDTLFQIVGLSPSDSIAELSTVTATFLKPDEENIAFTKASRLQQYSFTASRDTLLISNGQCVFTHTGVAILCLSQLGLSGIIEKIHLAPNSDIYFCTSEKGVIHLYKFDQTAKTIKTLLELKASVMAFYKDTVTFMLKDNDQYFFQTLQLTAIN